MTHLSEPGYLPIIVRGRRLSGLSWDHLLGFELAYGLQYHPLSNRTNLDIFMDPSRNTGRWNKNLPYSGS